MRGHTLSFVAVNSIGLGLMEAELSCFINFYIFCRIATLRCLSRDTTPQS